MSQAGFFDFEDWLAQLNVHGNPLRLLAEAIDFESFRETLEVIRVKPRKSNAGRRPYDAVLMFKMLVIQSLYSLADGQLEYQVRDRIRFMVFLGLRPGDAVPDEKTVWLFREQLAELGLVERLFERFDEDLASAGFAAAKGSIVDASIVEAPKQRNTREQNAQIKRGERPAEFDENPCKGRQKDTDARWVKKAGVNRFGYKNHVNVGARHKLIRRYTVTDTSGGGDARQPGDRCVARRRQHQQGHLRRQRLSLGGHHREARSPRLSRPHPPQGRAVQTAGQT
jgi:IS5 family transposase